MSFTPTTSTFADPKDDPEQYSHLQEVKKCTKFFEIIDDIGDVVLLHPLMVHSASKNRSIPRFRTNPPVSLKEPFNDNRYNPDDFSLVEKKTRGSRRLPDNDRAKEGSSKEQGNQG